MRWKSQDRTVLDRNRRLKLGMQMLFVTVLLLPLVFVLGGCGQAEPEPSLTTQKLSDLYPGDIGNVDYIEIRSGSTGKLVKVTDKWVIKNWIDEVRNLEFVPDPNQEDRVGYLYWVTLYENQEAKLSFTPSSTGGHYYLHNDQLHKKIEELVAF